MRIPPTPSHHLADLVALLAYLRAHSPWDKRQTHQSLRAHLSEECHELDQVLCAPIDDARLLDELSDVLLQVLMHAQIASERSAFGIDDVIFHLQDKLITRLAPVFTGERDEMVLERHWQQSKNLLNDKNMLDSKADDDTTCDIIACDT